MEVVVPARIPGHNCGREQHEEAASAVFSFNGLARSLCLRFIALLMTTAEMVIDMADQPQEFTDKIKASLREVLPEATEEVDEWVEEKRPLLLALFAESVANDLNKNQAALIKGIYRDLAGFQRRLLATWREPLHRLDSLIHMCMEVGDDINKEYRLNANAAPSSRRNVTTRLHTRAVQVSNEISCLLKGGYPDGAMARWRSLHETTVMLAFLAEHDEDLSKRFTDYQKIQRLRHAVQFNKHHAVLGFEPIPETDISRYRLEFDNAVEQYGKNFKEENGWATQLFNKPKVTFRDIEEFVEMSYLRPQYGFASKNVHSGIDSIGYKLGLSMSGKDILLAGPSNEGLIEPIQCTSFSLVSATSELISTSPTEDREVMETVLWKWHDLIKDEVLRASDALKEKGDAASK
ncbi:DUF5677 domain-containing protein [Paraburkholderia sediminicola]|uniref:DUF5677 domain-containing protein n=1 Tax=Paraburkholderia sediminicola TaxID=458836 RepID=UPI0038BC7EDE